MDRRICGINYINHKIYNCLASHKAIIPNELYNGSIYDNNVVYLNYAGLYNVINNPSLIRLINMYNDGVINDNELIKLIGG